MNQEALMLYFEKSVSRRRVPRVPAKRRVQKGEGERMSQLVEGEV
jgi:hypothetical protein